MEIQSIDFAMGAHRFNNNEAAYINAIKTFDQLTVDDILSQLIQATRGEFLVRNLSKQQTYFHNFFNMLLLSLNTIKESADALQLVGLKYHCEELIDTIQKSIHLANPQNFIISKFERFLQMLLKWKQYVETLVHRNSNVNLIQELLEQLHQSYYHQDSISINNNNSFNTSYVIYQQQQQQQWEENNDIGNNQGIQNEWSIYPVQQQQQQQQLHLQNNNSNAEGNQNQNEENLTKNAQREGCCSCQIF